MKKVNKIKKIITFAVSLSLQVNLFSCVSAKSNANFFKKHVGETIVSVVGTISLAATGVIAYNGIKSAIENKKLHKNFVEESEKKLTQKANENLVKKLQEENAKLKREKVRREVVEIFKKYKNYGLFKCQKKSSELKIDKIVSMINRGISEDRLKTNMEDIGLKEKCVDEITRYYRALCLLSPSLN